MGESKINRPEQSLIGNSPAIHRICNQLQKAALTRLPVLITGESGTGKDLVARLLHESSVGRMGTFMKMCCPFLPDHNFHRQFVHYETSPSDTNSSLCAGENTSIDRGTLFLDKIDELDITLQPKLLYALQASQAEQFGAIEGNVKDIRLICATGKHLETNVALGTFRGDLFYRINVFSIHIPPLRERLSDIPLLMNYFIRMYAHRYGCEFTSLSPDCLKQIMSYQWPGNIRELENLAKRFVILGGEEHILSAIRQREEAYPSFPEVIDLTTPLRIQTKRAMRHLERKIILSFLEAHKWDHRKTAHSLDISYRALLYKIKKEGPLKPSLNQSLIKQALSEFDKKPQNKYRN